MILGVGGVDGEHVEAGSVYSVLPNPPPSLLTITSWAASSTSGGNSSSRP